MKRLFQRRPKLTEQTLPMHLINEQLAYVGKTWEQVKDDPNWFQNNQLTKKQYNEWKEYCIEEIKKTYNFTIFSTNSIGSSKKISFNSSTFSSFSFFSFLIT